MTERKTAGKQKESGLSERGLLIDARQAFLPPRRIEKVVARGKLRLLEGPENELPSAA